MAPECIVLKEKPKIEFRLLASGFELVDERTKQNSGFYAYGDLLSIELNKVWYPVLAKWLKVITWIFNGVPLFPDAETCKKANIIMHFRGSRLGLWLTDPGMASKAKRLKAFLDSRNMG